MERTSLMNLTYAVTPYHWLSIGDVLSPEQVTNKNKDARRVFEEDTHEYIYFGWWVWSDKRGEFVSFDKLTKSEQQKLLQPKDGEEIEIFASSFFTWAEGCYYTLKAVRDLDDTLFWVVVED